MAAILALAAFTNTAKAQLTDEKNVTVTLDLQPVLQLNMSSADNLDFTFNSIASYAGGIVKYGATTLSVSATVGWTLFATGTSTNAQSGAGSYMDVLANYTGGNNTTTQAITAIPLDALELHQNVPNTVGGTAAAAGTDYSTAFVPYNTVATAAGAVNANVVSNANNIDILDAATPYGYIATPPVKYIEGTLAAPAPGGSYLINGNVNAETANPYSFVIDYRIIPGLPVVFPQSATPIAAPAYAAPGAYSMDVKYLVVQVL